MFIADATSTADEQPAAPAMLKVDGRAGLT